MTLKIDATQPSYWLASAPLRQDTMPAPSGAAYIDDPDDSGGLKSQAERTSVAEVMSRGIICIAADASLERVTQMLLERDIGSAPVVDAAWRPVGMISKTDLLHVWPELVQRPAGHVPLQKTVGDVAQRIIVSVRQTSPVSVAAALMASEGVHRLPVIDDAGEMVGMVSRLDLVSWIARCTNDEGCVGAP